MFSKLPPLYTILTKQLVLVICFTIFAVSCSKLPTKVRVGSQELYDYKVIAPDESFETSIPTPKDRPPTIEKINTQYVITIPAPKGQKIVCYLHNRPMDLAQALVRYQNSMDEELKDKAIPRLYNQTAGMVAGHPYISSDKIYFFNKEMTNFGNHKTTIIDVEERTLICTTNFPKTQKHLDLLLSHMLENIKFKQEVQSQYLSDVLMKEVYLLNANKSPVAINRVIVKQEAPKSLTFVSLTSSIVPGNPIQYIGQEWLAIEEVNEKHQVTNGNYQFLRNNISIYNIRLKRIENGDYRIYGNYYDSPINQKIPAPKNGALYHQYIFQTEFFKNHNNKKVGQYLPQFSPAEIIEATVKSKNKNSHAVEAIGLHSNFIFNNGENKITTLINKTQIDQNLKVRKIYPAKKEELKKFKAIR